MRIFSFLNKTTWVRLNMLIATSLLFLFTAPVWSQEEIELPFPEDILYRVPSPSETFQILKRNGLKFDASIEALSTGEEKDPHRRSLKTGRSIAHLNYLLIYHKALPEEQLKLLARLTLQDGFNPYGLAFVARIQNNQSNIDSLHFIFMEAFEVYCDFYDEYSETPEISELATIGSWVESTFVAASAAKESKNEELLSFLAAQQAFVDQFEEALKKLTHITIVNSLHRHFVELKQLYQKVNVTVKNLSVTTDDETQTTTINGKTKVKFPNKTLELIVLKLEEMRGFIGG